MTKVDTSQNKSRSNKNKRRPKVKENKPNKAAINKTTIIISIIISIVILLILYLWIFSGNKSTTTEQCPGLIKYRKQIFPVRISNITLKDDLKTEKYYHGVMEIANRFPGEVKAKDVYFLLKFRKFLELDDVYSMANDHEIDQVYKLTKAVIDNKIKGCFVETGVWKGGMGMWMKAIDKMCGNDDRDIYLFDTYEYFPEPSDKLKCIGNDKDKSIHNITKFLYTKSTIHTVDQVENNFKDINLMDKHIHFIKGELKNTTRSTKLNKIAILRIDNDYYNSILMVLKKYYNNITKGGYVIVDDYNNPVVGAKEAVDYFRKKHNIKNPIENTGEGSIYWQI